MPILQSPTFEPPKLIQNPHFQTIYPALLRRFQQVAYKRQRLELADGDFIDLDWLKNGHKQLLILLHGLEGNSKAGYIVGMGRAFQKRNWDVLAINFRGCSGQPNRLFRSYHSGDTGDLGFVLEQVLQDKKYTSVALVGFSLGGNVLLKYLGEQGAAISGKIVGAAGISVPCDLNGAAMTINKTYSYYFLKTLIPKLKQKVRAFKPEYPQLKDLKTIKTIKQFDNVYTSKAHGFRNADDYYGQCSSKNFIGGIKVPTLLINALDDPFFSEGCYPYQEAAANPQFHFLPVHYGGHVGFAYQLRKAEYWTEQVVADFLGTYVP